METDKATESGEKPGAQVQDFAEFVIRLDPERSVLVRTQRLAEATVLAAAIASAGTLEIEDRGIRYVQLFNLKRFNDFTH